jgi:acetyl-CoA acetyltransferase
VTREQLAMVPVLASRQAVRHPLALTKRALTLDEVLAAKPVAPHTGLLECARRADGGACVIRGRLQLRVHTHPSHPTFHPDVRTVPFAPYRS